MRFLKILPVFLFCLPLFAAAQKKPQDQINEIVTQREVEAHLTFLAADEMRGRNAGSPEIEIAANYIRTCFKIYGLEPAPGAPNYFQPVGLERATPPTVAEVTLDKEKYVFKENLLVLGGDTVHWRGEAIYVGYGSQEELERVDVKGKVVLAIAGSRDADNVNKVFSASRDKYRALAAKGALGLVEIMALPNVPWPAMVNFLSQPVWGLSQNEKRIPFVWLKRSNMENGYKESQMVPVTIRVEGSRRAAIPGKNVAAFVPGTDPKLKDEYVVMTAHYDHVGVQKQADGQDSIFNGARDNATGTVALLQAAKYFSRNPPKRTVLFVALTSEEKGLLGSQWYTEHPLVPLNKTVLNINCDGVGYNDKTRITSISLGRTNVDEGILKAAKTYSLEVGGDPDPKENFYERSDQASFAKKGIPAIKLQPGLAQMDDEIRKYYHRAADEVSSMDLEYITKFYRTYVFAASLIVSDPQRPAWKPGDKFEAESKKLYSGK